MSRALSGRGLKCGGKSANRKDSLLKSVSSPGKLPFVAKLFLDDAKLGASMAELLPKKILMEAR